MSCNFNPVSNLFLLSRNNRETTKDTHLPNIARKIQGLLHCETEIYWLLRKYWLLNSAHSITERLNQKQGLWTQWKFCHWNSLFVLFHFGFIWIFCLFCFALSFLNFFLVWGRILKESTRSCISWHFQIRPVCIFARWALVRPKLLSSTQECGMWFNGECHPGG